MSNSYSRRQFLRWAGTGLAATGLSGPLLGMGHSAGRAQKLSRKRNVLFIAVDDLRPQLGCYGHNHILSPNIDRLAERGLVFNRAYCQLAMCGPSRASVMSGLRPDSIGNYHWNFRLRDELPEVLTLPEHFRKNGYETTTVGKVYHDPTDDPRGFTTKPYNAFHDMPQEEKTWSGLGYVTEEAKQIVLDYQDAIGRGPAYERADAQDGAYPDDCNLRHAIGELNRLKDKPFFLGVGFYKPHLPFNAPKKYWEMYDPKDIKLPDNMYYPQDVPKIALSNWKELRQYYGMPQDGDLTEETARTLIHGYYACVSYTDALVGKLLDELDRLGLRENTVVVLWGDHGWKLGEHNMWCKHTNFELDTRAPLIIRVPGMKTAGQKTDALTEFVDIYPTLCDICDLGLPGHLEGYSMAPLLKDPAQKWKKAAFSQYPRWDTTDPEFMGYTMRTDRFRYTEWILRKTGEIKARELYDHENDPAENINVVDQPKYAKDVERLSILMKRGWKGALPD